MRNGAECNATDPHPALAIEAQGTEREGAHLCECSADPMHCPSLRERAASVGGG